MIEKIDDVTKGVAAFVGRRFLTVDSMIMKKKKTQKCFTS